ncbi:MAG: hypothetical protein EP330_16850 [Deltaproteobacteria bacterium]|nr:MAG: hypothetical protein EP330_16850 [Deltaproteobacteria bacterium]
MADWTPLRDDLWTCTYKVPGLPCRSWALRLADGRFLIGSPGESLAEDFDLGEVAVLLAPNNFHHMGLHAWRARFPEAVAVAGRDALPRLAKQGHEGLVSVGEISELLPGHAAIHELPDTRSGEVWLVHRSDEGAVWVVCDAFFNMPAPRRAAWKAFMWVNRSGPGLAISQLQKWGGLKQRAGFAAWVRERLAEDPPSALVPLHGAIETGDDLARRLDALVAERIG